MVSLKGFVFLAWISFGLGSLIYAALASNERTLIFKEPFPDKALPGHVIRTEQVPNEGSCRVKCYLESNCVSINVGPGTEGQLTCELNNHTDDSPSHSLLEERKHYIHYFVENFCHGDPCPDNVSVCQVGFTSKGYRCACHEGYTTTGDHGQCEDINECTNLGANNCSSNGNCVNKPGFFECNCLPGYTGNGVICEDVDECNMTGSGNCSLNADCINQLGSFECKCRPGYTGDGVSCDDLNECSTSGANNCSSNAGCVNELGSFKCNCNPGYTGNGVICYDIDECSFPGFSSCSSNADCINQPGSFQCNCRPGYTGDGIRCEDNDECTDCSPFAVCNNIPGSFACSCKSGFTGNGKTCTVICPSSSWIGHGRSCYQLFTTPQSWHSANSVCMNNGSLLVKIESPDENDFIRMKYLTSRADYWIGLTDEVTEGVWVWSDGTGLTGYLNWGGNQPNSAGNQDCGGIRMGKHYKTYYYAQWHDFSCSGKKGFICEKLNPV